MSELRFDTAVVVFDTASSGTSPIASVLESAGLTLPRTSAVDASQRGLAAGESSQIGAISRQVLNELDLKPTSATPMTHAAFEQGQFANFRRCAQEALRIEFPEGCNPLIVHSTAPRAIPFWRDVLEGLASRTAFFIVVREPFGERDYDDRPLSWTKYYVEAEFHTRGLPRSFLLNQATTAGWQEQLDLASSALELGLQFQPVRESGVRRRAGLDIATVESRAGRKAGAEPTAADLFRIMVDWSRGVAETSDDHACFDRARAGLNRVDQSPGPGDSDRLARIESAIASLAEAARERRGLDEALAAAVKAQAALRLDADDVYVDLKRIKRKYRAAQQHLELERDAHRLTRDRLAEAQITIQGYRRTIPRRAYSGLAAALRHLGAQLRRATGGDRRRLRAAAESVESSAYFDRLWYLTRYADVAAVGLDPALHYLEHGWREGRDPGPLFSTSAYLKSNADVARAGINPLLHFIEFGASEGRGVPADALSKASSGPPPGEPFGDPAPCVAFPISPEDPIRWRRAAGLSAVVGRDVIVVDEVPIGLGSVAAADAELAAGFEALAALSGCTDAVAADRLPGVGNPSRLIDAWYVTDRRLRCRWRPGDGPTVIRAFQHHPDGQLVMVAEGLAALALDFVDVSPTNPYFPLLFVFSDPDATVRGCELLAFPSACRGGVHYPELVAGVAVPDNSSQLDISGRGMDWAASLLSIHRGEAPSLVATLEVELTGADGTHPLFQADFRTWLKQVMRIAVRARDIPVSDARFEHLAHMIGVEPLVRRNSGGTLLVASDMAPAIGLLTAAGPTDRPNEPTLVSLIVATSDPAQPATLVQLPPTDSAALRASASDLVVPWPRFIPGVDGHSPASRDVAAVRLADQRLPTEAELLVPYMATGLESSCETESITWLVYPSEWPEEALAMSLQALARQDYSELAQLRLVGSAAPKFLALARGFLGERVQAIRESAAARRDFSTPLAGYLGPGLILHDKRTSSVLAPMLRDASVVSASCVLISSERRGKGWNTTVADPGSIAGVLQSPSPTGHRDATFERLWRSTYPVLAPPRDLWIVRSASLAQWAGRIGPLAEAEGAHVCTSLVTASYVAERSAAEPRLRLPPAAETRSARIEAVFG